MMWNFKEYSRNIAAICEDGSQITYSQLENMSITLARQIDKRCLVFVLCTNTPGSLLGYVSFMNNNVVPVLLDAGLDKALLTELVATYLPNYIWCPQSVSPEFADVDVVGESLWGYTLLKTKHPKSYELYDELALLLTTSGSTGSPKLVRQSYANIRANTQSIVEYLGIDQTERAITTLPMNYTYGLSIINTHLYVGATIVFTQKSLMQKEFWQQFAKQEVTSFGGVPYTYEMLDRLRFFRMDLPSLRYMTQAGGKLSPELHKKFAEYAAANGKKFVVMYGQTEATARMSYLPAEKSLDKYGSMGIAIPGGRFELIDVDGQVISDSETVGELVYYGANVTLGYAECGQDLVKGDENNGTLITGDMAKRDVEGYYFVVGRKKRFLKIYGSRVNLDEVERMLRGQFQSIDCACGGIDDKLFIFSTHDGSNSDMKRFLCEKTGINHVAVKVVFVDQIPRNEAGKILYKDLASHYQLD